MDTRTKLQIISKDYSSILPFQLTVVYKNKGDLKDMIMESSKKYPELIPLLVEEMGRSLCFVFHNQSSGTIFLFITDEFGLDILAHECTHIVFRIFEIIDSPISNDTEEFFAYIQEFIFREVLNMLRKRLRLKIDLLVR